jgi:hypothetical protein
MDHQYLLTLPVDLLFREYGVMIGLDHGLYQAESGDGFSP